MNEAWKDVAGYVGLYKVSNRGNVYSCKRKKLLCPALIDGYKCVNLYKDGKYKIFGVHRLVAIAFIPNPNNLPVVNHINANKSINTVENLEWCTQKENVHHYLVKQAEYKSINESFFKIFQKTFAKPLDKPRRVCYNIYNERR